MENWKTAKRYVDFERIQKCIQIVPSALSQKWVTKFKIRPTFPWILYFTQNKLSALLIQVPEVYQEKIRKKFGKMTRRKLNERKTYFKMD